MHVAAWHGRVLAQLELAFIMRRLAGPTSTADFCVAITRAAVLHERLLTVPCFWPTPFDLLFWVAAR